MRTSLADFRWVAVLLLALFPRTAQADPIVITGGGFTEFAIRTGIEWSNFRLTADDSSFTGVVCCYVGGLQAGSIDLRNTGVPLLSTVPFAQATQQVVHGTSYTAFLTDSRLTFMSDFVSPPPPSAGSTFEFSTPFTMTGHIAGTSSISPPGISLFSDDVTGNGTLTVSGIIRNPGTSSALYDISSARYGFDASPSPTPEPSTLLLLGSAVVGVFWRRARSRKTPPSASARTLRPSVRHAASS